MVDDRATGDLDHLDHIILGLNNEYADRRCGAVEDEMTYDKHPAAAARNLVVAPFQEVLEPKIDGNKLIKRLIVPVVDHPPAKLKGDQIEDDSPSEVELERLLHVLIKTLLGEQVGTFE